MLQRARSREVGFTLIELMIVVAIVGILAILAIFGVRKHLAVSKSAEATTTLGHLNRLSMAAWERENATAELTLGASSVSLTHALCGASTAVPVAVASIQNRKYTANTSLAAADYHSGNTTVGWTCLKFEMNQPQYYRYKYQPGAPTITGLVVPLGAQGWTAEAQGDLNGDGIFSGFAAGGNIQNGNAMAFTQLAVNNPEE
jgi:type IV pilus assembly protein PilA